MKIQKLSILLIMFGIICFSSDWFYQDSSGSKFYSDPIQEELKLKREVDASALVNVNDDYITKKWIVEKNDIYTKNSLLEFDMLFKNIDFLQSDVKDLRIEFKDSQKALKYRAQNVDVFGIYYTGFCQGEIGIRTGCMYGGVTPHDNNTLDNIKNIGVNVIKDGDKIKTFSVETQKRKVTVQEVDVKVRTRINNDFKIYDIHSDIQKGFIKFHSHMPTSDSFYYDLYNIKGKFPSSYLQIYDDNKIINSSEFHIDVYLFTK